MARATRRLGLGARRTRSDRGASRLPAAVETELARLLSSVDRPSMTGVARALEAFAERRGLRAPSRATLYNALERAPVPHVPLRELPNDVRDALYNLVLPEHGSSPPPDVPLDHVVYYAFNYGTPRAIAFAAGLPWLCLWRALRRGGWRPKSRALLEAVAKFRGL